MVVDNENSGEPVGAAKKLSKLLDAVVFKMIRLQDSSHMPRLSNGLSDAKASEELVRRYFNSQPNIFQSLILSVYYKARHILVTVLKCVLRVLRSVAP